MRKSIYHKQLEFLYSLTKISEYYNHRGLSKKIRIDKKRITPQTIQNWFSYFNQNGFNYFHSIIFEKIGLRPAFILSKNILPENSFKDNVWQLCNLNSLETIYLENYLIPCSQTDYFKSIYLDQCAGIYFLKSPFVITPPYHMIFNRNHNSETVDREIKEFIAKFKYYLSRLDKIEECKVLKRDPFILPVILASRKNISSADMWNSIKYDLGSDAKKYLIRERYLKDEVALKRVQHHIRQLNNEYNHLVQQIDIDYKPLLRESIPFLMIVEYNNKDCFLSFMHSLSSKSLRTVVYPNEYSALIFCHLSYEGINYIAEQSKDVNVKSIFYVTKNLARFSFDYKNCFD